MKYLKLVSNFTVKGVTEEDEDIIIEGFANTTTKDRVGDIILEEAWTKGGLDNYLKNPILLAFHDHTRPIGSMIDYGVNNKGLKITGKISKAAGEVYELVKSGMLKAFSVGFRVKEADYDTDTDIFVIKDLDLHEISVVSVPANADSLFSVHKSFENENEYNEFKDSFIKVDEKLSTDNKGDTNKVDKEENKGVAYTLEQIADLQQKAIDKAFAEAKAKAEAEEETKKVAIEAGKSGAERLLADIEKKFEDKNVVLNEALEGLRADLKEKAAEIEAINRSKMSFEDNANKRPLTDLEIDTAVLVAKAVGKRIDETEYFKAKLATKAVGDGDHLGGTNAAAYETIYSSRMYDAIKEKLVMEPLFTNRIAMSSRAMVFPFNPEAGYASWIADAQYKSFRNPDEEITIADGAGVGNVDTSTGPARNHAVTDISIQAEKLASKEALGYEEEEDAIIPIVPIISAAIARRMARSTDTELLRANAGAATVADIGTAPTGFNGVATLATDLGTSFTQAGAFAATNPITVADLQATRRQMGPYGLNPADVVYVVNESAYYDLLEDPDFRTLDLVGAKATILSGQIGTVNGSPVIVSDSFATPASGIVAGIALNVSNYIFGELRGLTTERDKDVLNQKNWIVTTRRFAFTDIDATATSCSALLYGS